MKFFTLKIISTHTFSNRLMIDSLKKIIILIYYINLSISHRDHAKCMMQSNSRTRLYDQKRLITRISHSI